MTRGRPALLAALAPMAAAAGGVSADVQLAPVQAAAPSLGSAALAVPAERGALRLGLAVDYLDAPLVLVQRDDAVGRIVGQRLVTTAGLGVALTERVWVDAAVPVAGQWDSDEVALRADGVGLMDPRVGVRARVVDGPVALGLRAHGTLPIGTRGAWLGEPLPRAELGAVGTATAGPLTAVMDLGGVLRARGEDPLAIGSEARALAGLALRVRDRADLWAQAHARLSADDPDWIALEASAGVALDLSAAVRVDLGGGAALLEGYGLGPARARAAVVWTVPTRRPEPPPAVVLPADPAAWAPGERARVREGEVELRAPIAFAPRAVEPVPASWPDLLALAELLQAHPEITHLLVEGYASSAGSTRRNYALSLARARAVVDALVTAGVDRDRLSYRGMGELSPSAPGEGHQVLRDGLSVPFNVLVVPDAIGEVGAAVDGSFADWLTRRRGPR